MRNAAEQQSPYVHQRACDELLLRADARTDEGEPERPEAAGLTIGRLLGRGGSAVVWQATADDGRRFALKVPTTPSDPPSDPASGASSATVAGHGGSAPTRHGRRAATAPSAADRPRPCPPEPGRRGAPAGRSLPQSPGQDGARASAGRGVVPCGEPDALARELALLQRFSHEHLLRVHRIVPTSQGPALLIDLAAGGSLLALVSSRGPLPIPEVVTSLVPIAQVLHHLHEAGAAHGDVTPGNILLTHEGKPLLADFGTGCLLGADESGTAGTPGFIDPSRTSGFDAGADVFALAAVSWFAMTGRVPGPTEQRPPLSLIVPDVPAALMQLIEDALSADRGRRPSCDQFARALLGSSSPRPVDLVPAVHPSVLPELLTRRSAVPSAERRPGWRRSRMPGRFRDPKEPGRRSSGIGRRGPSPRTTGPSSTRAATGTGRKRSRRAAVAIGAGLLSVILLVAGLALTLVEPRASHPIPEAQSTGSDNHDPGAGQDGAGLDSTGQGGAGQGGAGLDAAGQGGAGLDAGQDAAGQGSAGLDAGQGAAGQGSAGQDAGQGGTGQDAAGQVQDAGAAPGTDGPSGADAAAIPSGAARDTSLSTDPAIALGGLATLRAEAFATANPSLLSAVDVEGSPAITEDRAALQALAESGTTLQDLTIAIVQPAALDPPARAALPALAGLPAVADAPKATEVALVRATAALSPYTEAPSGPLDGDGGPSSRGASRQDMIFVLWNSGDGWRIHSTVTPPT